MVDTTGSDESEDAATVQLNPAAMAELLADLEPTEDVATVMFASLNIEELMGESVLMEDDAEDETSFETPRPAAPRDPLSALNIDPLANTAHPVYSAAPAATGSNRPASSPRPAPRKVQQRVELQPPPSMRHGASQPAAPEAPHVSRRPVPRQVATPTRESLTAKARVTATSAGGTPTVEAPEIPSALWAGAGVCAALALGVLFYVFA